jgi:hypothetical protein
MSWIRQLIRFAKVLFRKPTSVPGTIEDSPETEIEKERRRGIRGD